MSNIRKLMADGGGDGTRRTDPKPPLDRGEVARAVGAMLLSAVVAGILAAMALMLLLVTDGCGPGLLECNPTMFAIGFFVALLVPPVVAVAGFLTTTVLLARRRRRPWRGSLIAIPATVLVWLVGAVLTFVSVPGYGLGDYLGVLSTIGG